MSCTTITSAARSVGTPTHILLPAGIFSSRFASASSASSSGSASEPPCPHINTAYSRRQYEPDFELHGIFSNSDFYQSTPTHLAPLSSPTTFGYGSPPKKPATTSFTSKPAIISGLQHSIFAPQEEDVFSRSRASDKTQVEILKEKFGTLQGEWDVSPQKKVLVTFIRERILTSTNLKIDNAICLSIGSFINSPEVVPSYSTTSSDSPDLVNTEDESYTMLVRALDAFSFSEVSRGSSGRSSIPALPPFSAGRPLNKALFNLILFETIGQALLETQHIKDVSFQDPSFTAVDVEFLEGRGYKVLTHPQMMSHPDMTSPPGPQSGVVGLDPAVRDAVDGNTFLFAPQTGAIVARLVGTKRPGLFLGQDLCGIIGRYRKYEREVASYIKTTSWYEIEGSVATGLGLVFPADLEDAKEVEDRNTRVKIVEEKIAERKKFEMKVRKPGVFKVWEVIRKGERQVWMRKD